MSQSKMEHFRICLYSKVLYFIEQILNTFIHNWCGLLYVARKQYYQ